MKKVVYTAIVGLYDYLKDPLVVSNDFDYICFTDQPFISNIWKIVPIPDELKNLSKVKQQRVIKICPHRYLKEYDLSIWVDGNISIIGDMNEFISQYDLDKYMFLTRIHPGRNCIYKEAQACINKNKDDPIIIQNQIDKYKNEGYPENIGVVETGILLRKHNYQKCIDIDNQWSIELLKNSHRDQLSFNYICWKNHFQPEYLTHEFSIVNNKYFKFNSHGR